MEQKKHERDNVVCEVWICGSKGVSQYGGYESFVQKLLEYSNDPRIQYHVACKANGDGHMDVNKLEGAEVIDDTHFKYHSADCFMIKVPEWLRSAQAVYYDIAALRYCCREIKKNKIKKPIVYILTCRIGPFMRLYEKKIHAVDGKIYLNPDGHEWMRAKWSKPVRKYWKNSEKLMVKDADLIICDSLQIEDYIKKEYAFFNPKTIYISYGAEIKKSVGADERFDIWKMEHDIKGDYYTVVGRCVPENNFETIIREFMKSKSDKDLVIITTNNPAMIKDIERKLYYREDKRIKFVGTVYDGQLLKKIREESYGYIHGHSVGGTNPSLLEAMGSTRLNLLLDVGFNREVGRDTVLYWKKDRDSLTNLIDQVDRMSSIQIDELGKKAKQRIRDKYNWGKICSKYEKIFK